MQNSNKKDFAKQNFSKKILETSRLISNDKQLPINSIKLSSNSAFKPFYSQLNSLKALSDLAYGKNNVHESLVGIKNKGVNAYNNQNSIPKLDNFMLGKKRRQTDETLSDFKNNVCLDKCLSAFLCLLKRELQKLRDKKCVNEVLSSLKKLLEKPFKSSDVDNEFRILHCNLTQLIINGSDCLNKLDKTEVETLVVSLGRLSKSSDIDNTRKNELQEFCRFLRKKIAGKSVFCKGKDTSLEFIYEPLKFLKESSEELKDEFQNLYNAVTKRVEKNACLNNFYKIGENSLLKFSIELSKSNDINKKTNSELQVLWYNITEQITKKNVYLKQFNEIGMTKILNDLRELSKLNLKFEAVYYDMLKIFVFKMSLSNKFKTAVLQAHFATDTVFVITTKENETIMLEKKTSGRKLNTEQYANLTIRHQPKEPLENKRSEKDKAEVLQSKNKISEGARTNFQLNDINEVKQLLLETDNLDNDHFEIIEKSNFSKKEVVDIFRTWIKKGLLIRGNKIKNALRNVSENQATVKQCASCIMQTNTQENVKPNMDTEEMPKQEQMK